MSITDTSTSPTAADSGAPAGAVFRADKRYRGTAETSAERVDTILRALLGAVHQVVSDHEITYPEFQAAKSWLMEVGEGDEWPLLLDVFVEHAVEEVASRSRQGTKGSIEGPYYLPGSRRLPAHCELPRRADEKGTPLSLTGQVRDVNDTPLPGAEVDIWHADADGHYSGFAPHLPEGNLRGLVVTDDEGRFSIRTIRPAPYRIPADGPTGRMIAAAGRHPWRPAHLHVMVRAEGHRQVTTQLYFEGGAWVDDDVARATKPELFLRPVADGEGGLVQRYDFVLERA
ncbi:dioxygenase [Streptomyces sp. NPDC014744]|uniref:dioxygenase family protein n=1 Tax=Streptomyces sp. NPDC014744 TaxID=3364903 RepID=UPI0037034958